MLLERIGRAQRLGKWTRLQFKKKGEGKKGLVSKKELNFIKNIIFHQFFNENHLLSQQKTLLL